MKWKIPALFVWCSLPAGNPKSRFLLCWGGKYLVLTCALNSDTVLTCALNRNTEMRYRIGLLLKPPWGTGDMDIANSAILPILPILPIYVNLRQFWHFCMSTIPGTCFPGGKTNACGIPITPQKGYVFKDVFLLQKQKSACGMPSTPQKCYNLINRV